MDATVLSRQFINLLKKQGVSLDQAYLFGSYARGKTWAGSDIDVCLVSQDFNEDYETRKNLIVKSALAIDSRIEPVMYTPEEFANKYDILATEVKRFGISLIK